MTENTFCAAPTCEPRGKGLTASQLRKVRALVRGECANLDGRLCLPWDKPCPMLESSTFEGICSYFKLAVLPMDVALEAELTGKIRPASKTCAVCDSKYFPTSNRQSYCSADCERKANRIKSRERMERMRRKKGVGVTI